MTARPSCQSRQEPGFVETNRRIRRVVRLRDLQAINLTTRWGLALVNATTFTGTRQIPGAGEESMWFRGTGTVKVELTDEGKEILGDLAGPIELRYSNGPILSPAGKEDLPE